MGMLKRVLNWFWELHRHVVSKNSKLKGVHSGETCIIMGNGGSLKYYDLSVLPDLPIFCTTHSLADKRLAKNLNVRYWVLSDPYLLYPLRYMDRYKKIFRNQLLPLFKSYAAKNPNVTLITSLTNWYSFFRQSKNIIYFHHFGDKSSSSFDLSQNFATCSGALDIMIGAARYLGFSKAIILGCDYLGSPKLEGHFYGDEAPYLGIDDPGYASRISQLAGDLEVVAIFPQGYKSSFFKSASYGEYFGGEEKYQSNVELIDPEQMALMRRAARTKQIHL
jgi:hypothetical protein